MTGYCDISGARLYYKKKGKGPPIIFLHGFCLDNRMWENQLDFFSGSYTTLAIDLRGFGRSTFPTDKIYSHHEDIHALLDTLQITQPAILVGLSMGGRVVADFALSYPQKTKVAVFVDAVIDGYEFMNFNLGYIYKSGKEQGIAAANQMWLNHELFESARKIPSVSVLLAKMIMSYSGWHWINKNPVRGLHPPAIEQMQDLVVPTLIITGQYDTPDFQAIAQILHSKINHSSKKEIGDAGHMCNMEKPTVFNEILDQFLTNHK
jgi:3-oxoadipate enol-lactonase